MKPMRQGVNDVICIVRGGDDTSLHGKEKKTNVKQGFIKCDVDVST
jgi:hypothetical protein